MEKIVDRKDCCGCAACFAACNHQTINMVVDECGFLYPTFNADSCVDCGLCKSSCPIIKRDSEHYTVDNQEFYACHNNDGIEWKASSSGGIFRVLADYMIEQGGYVVGAVYDEEFVVRHFITNKKEDLDKFRGSKYVQSDTRTIFKEVKDALKTGLPILFTGTPCQTEAIKCYLRKPYENLLTCDIICNSVPSPVVFRDYISFLESKYGTRVVNINMKDKTNGWPNTKARVFFENGKSIFDSLDSDLWFNAWSSTLISRRSCANCRFTNYNRPGDITIGDCWAIFHKNNSFLSPNGISQLMINTKKGKLLIEKVKERMTLLPITKEYSWQSKLEYPISINPKSEEFWEDYNKMEFKTIAQKYWNYSLRKYYFSKYSPFLSRIIKIFRI